MVIATKAGFVIRDGERIVDTSRRALLRDLDGSLSRLQTDYVDLWQIHAFGDAPLAESLAAVDHAVATGRVRYAGVSNFVGWQTAQAATWQSAFPGRTPISSAQVEYSLLARRAEVEVLPAVRAFGMGFFPWSPLGRGVLTGQYRTGTPRGSRAATDHFAWFVEPYLEPRSRGVVEAVARAAEGLDLTPLQVALLWVRDAPGVTAPLLGARTAGQLAPALAVEDQQLPDEIASALDDVSGGPNAPADPAVSRVPYDRATRLLPDDLAADPDVAGAVAIAAQPGQLPAAVLGLFGQQLPDGTAGQVPAQPHPLDLILDASPTHRGSA